MSSDDNNDMKSVWIICGLPGTGKSLLLNSLTNASAKVANTSESVTTPEDAIKCARNPIVGKPELDLSGYAFCDSEGIGAAGVTGKKQLIDCMMPTFTRLLAGAAGVIFCMKACDRLLMQDVMFAKAIFETCGEVPIVVCITGYDVQLCNVENFKMDLCKPYVRDWADKSLPNFLAGFGVNFNRDDCAIVSARLGDIAELITILHTHENVCRAARLQKLKETNEIIETQNIDENGFRKIHTVALKLVDDVSKMPWFIKFVNKLLERFGLAIYNRLDDFFN